MNNSKRILIVGGGTAGWMTANILAYSFQNHNFEITVVESEDIPIIGVGEGSTPALKIFFDCLGISEQEWMPACNATFKCGITFKNWSTKPGFTEYFHPFASHIDGQTLPTFFKHVQARLSGLDVEAHPNQFFLAAKLAEENLTPIPNHNFPFEPTYGYHFDAVLLGQFLRKKAAEKGIKKVVGTVEQVSQHTNGDIKSLTTKDQITLTADLFIDCTGFSSLLSQKTLKTPYISYAPHLFNDAAVAIPSDLEGVLPSQTYSIALRHGWAWKIPLRNRFGNGYVYSSAHCSADEAETELRERLGMLNADVEARHLKMNIGRVEKSWNQNVLAVGLSQGFIEPLEATALLLIQQTVSLFAHYYTEGKFTNAQQGVFNQKINHQFDHTRDYILTHYQTNSREDTEYWLDNRNNPEPISDSLTNLYLCWNSGQNLEEEIRRQQIEGFYPVSSWYCIFTGMGILPPLRSPNPIQSQSKEYDIDKIRDFIHRCSLNFIDHKQYLESQFAPNKKYQVG